MSPWVGGFFTSQSPADTLLKNGGKNHAYPWGSWCSLSELTVWHVNSHCGGPSDLKVPCLWLAKLNIKSSDFCGDLSQIFLTSCRLQLSDASRIQGSEILLTANHGIGTEELYTASPYAPSIPSNFSSFHQRDTSKRLSKINEKVLIQKEGAAVCTDFVREFLYQTSKQMAVAYKLGHSSWAFQARLFPRNPVPQKMHFP